MTAGVCPTWGGSREKRATVPQVRPSSAAPGSEQMSVKPWLRNVLCPGGDKSRPAGRVCGFLHTPRGRGLPTGKPSLRLRKALSCAGGQC